MRCPIALPAEFPTCCRASAFSSIFLDLLQVICSLREGLELWLVWDHSFLRMGNLECEWCCRCSMCLQSCTGLEGARAALP